MRLLSPPIRYSPWLNSAFRASHASNASNASACCDLAVQNGIMPAIAISNQSNTANLPAATPLWVSYDHCSSRWTDIGFILSQPGNLQYRGSPFIHLILPSIILSMTVPRRKKIECGHLFDFPHIARWSISARHQWLRGLIRLTVSLLLSIILLVPVIIDTVLWIIIIIVGAGNMLVAGLYEAYLDFRIIQRIQDANSSLGNKTELLLTLVCGNLIIDS